MISDLYDIFSSEYTVSKISDNLKTYESKISYDLTSCNEPEKESLEQVILQISNVSNILTFDIYLNSSLIDSNFLDSVDEGIDTYLEYINTVRDDGEEATITIDLILEKSLNNFFPIFDISFFEEQSKNIPGFIDEINSRVKISGTLVFISNFFTDEYITPFIKFTKNGFSPVLVDDSWKDVVSEKYELTTSKNYNSVKLVPDCFDVSFHNTKVDQFFKSIRNIISSMYIFSTSELKDNKYRFQVYTGNILNLILTDSYTSDVLYHLYKWAYVELSKTEVKLGLIQSQIHLYIKDNNLGHISEIIVSSVKSHYKLYLKENLDKYLKEKENVENIIRNNIDENFKIISGFSSTLGSNLLGVLTFYTSVIVLGAISGDMFKLFNKEISTVSYVIICCSLLFLVAQNIFIRQKLDYHNSIKERIINRYSDLFVEQDLYNITNHIEGDYESKRLLKKSIITFTLIWLFTLILLIILTTEFGHFKSESKNIYSLSLLIISLYSLIIINISYWEDK